MGDKALSHSKESKRPGGPGSRPGDVSRKVWLTFPKDRVGGPVIWEVGQKFEVVTNIRQASISEDMGLVGLEISGQPEEVSRAIEYFRLRGVSAEPVEPDAAE